MEINEIPRKVCDSRFANKKIVKRHIQKSHKEYDADDEDDALLMRIRRKHFGEEEHSDESPTVGDTDSGREAGGEDEEDELSLIHI